MEEQAPAIPVYMEYENLIHKYIIELGIDQRKAVLALKMEAVLCNKYCFKYKGSSLDLCNTKYGTVAVARSLKLRQTIGAGDKVMKGKNLPREMKILKSNTTKGVEE